VLDSWKNDGCDELSPFSNTTAIFSTYYTTFEHNAFYCVFDFIIIVK